MEAFSCQLSRMGFSFACHAYSLEYTSIGLLLQLANEAVGGSRDSGVQTVASSRVAVTQATTQRGTLMIPGLFSAMGNDKRRYLSETFKRK